MSKKFWSFKSFGKQKQPEIKLDKDELKKKLTPIQYRVTQDKITERPFSGEYLKLKDNGMYACIVCDQELFSSTCKYDSGCGWPAFYDAENPEKLILKPDLSHVGSNLILLAIKPDLVRTEVTCGKCGAHLGHVFDDGPKPTGLRYCINSAALKFNPACNVPADSLSCSTSTSTSSTSGDRIPSSIGQDEKCSPNNSVTNQNNTLKTAAVNTTSYTTTTTAAATTTGSMATESATIVPQLKHNKLQSKLDLPTQTNGNLTITPKGNLKVSSSSCTASTSNCNCNSKSTSTSATRQATEQQQQQQQPQRQPQQQSTHMQINLPVNHSMTPSAINSTTELKVNQSPSNLRQKLRMEFYYGTSA